MDSERGDLGRVSILNVGTKILLKDVMDQYLRTLGDFKTYYAPNMSSALRVFQENTIQVILTEVDLGDGSAYRLIKELGGDNGLNDLYVILALEDRSDALIALATEIEAHAIIVKPFSAQDLKAQIDRFTAWRVMPKEPWLTLIEEARLAARDRRYRDAEVNFVEAMKLAPTNPVPFYKAGMYYIEKGDASMAETFLKKSVELKANYVPAVAALGRVYLAKHDLVKAEEFLRKAHEISPLNPDRLVEMVRMYIERSVEACKNSLRVDPSATAPHLLLGKLRALLKDYTGSVQELEKALPTLRDSARLEAQTYIALSRKLGGIAKS